MNLQAVFKVKNGKKKNRGWVNTFKFLHSNHTNDLVLSEGKKTIRCKCFYPKKKHYREMKMSSLKLDLYECLCTEGSDRLQWNILFN